MRFRATSRRLRCGFVSNDDDNGLWELSTQDGGSSFPPPTPPTSPEAGSGTSSSLPPTIPMASIPADTPDVDRPDDDPRRAYVVGGISFALMLVIGLVIALAIGGDDSDDGISVSPASTLAVDVSTTVAAAPTTISPVVPATDGATTDTSTTVAANTTTTTPSDLFDAIVIASRDGVHRITPGGSETLLGEAQQMALVLGDGRLVVQANGGRIAASAAETTVYLVSADGRKQVVVSPTPGSSEFITLHDAFQRDGAWHALVTIHSGSNIDDSQDDLVMVNLETGVRTSLAYVGGWEDGAGRFTVAGDLAVSEFYVTVTRGPLFISLVDGTTPDPGIFGIAPGYDDCSVCPSLFAISPDGTELAWVEGEFVVIADTATGDQTALLPIPRQLGRQAISIDLGSSAVIVNFRSTYGMGDAPVPNPIVMTRAGRVVDLPHEGVASFVER